MIRRFEEKINFPKCNVCKLEIVTEPEININSCRLCGMSIKIGRFCCWDCKNKFNKIKRNIKILRWKSQETFTSLKFRKNFKMKKSGNFYKKRFQNLGCVFTQITIKDFENTENKKFSVCSFSGENIAWKSQ